MTAKDAIKHNIEFCHDITGRYVADMSDADLMVRAVPGMNHIAWQLGHLICSYRTMLGWLGHAAPELPAGFEEAHGQEAARCDDTSRFAKKEEYLTLLEKMKAATLAAVDATPEADLDKPGPEQMKDYCPTVGAALALCGTHELMHAGQYVAVRRKLGKPVLF